MSTKKAATASAATSSAEPSLPPVNNYRPWYVALLVMGLLVLGAAVALALLGTFNSYERQFFQWINHAYLPSWVSAQLAKPLSNAVWGMAGLVALLLIVPKFRWRAWQYAVAGGASYAVTFCLEHAVGRARPMDLAGYDAVLRATQSGAGFPSTHVAVLTALALTLWPYVAWPWRIVLLLLVVAEAWARIFLGVHAPLDVVGGIGVGMAVVAAIHLVPQKLRSFLRLSA